MIQQVLTLFRYRLLIESLVSRELKARYRGSVLGFFWSFVNPLLMLLVYVMVFTVIQPASHLASMEPYALFLFCGILPWSWLAGSLLESSGVVIAGGNLIKKVLFPAEILPVVTVLTNMVQFLLGLPVLFGFLIAYGKLKPTALLLPLPVLVQLVFTLGLALFVSALTVHFRDVRGTRECFTETFHDNGPTDMFAAMKAYQDVGFDGPMRPDHVPQMVGEDDGEPGYTMKGRLFAFGYMRGLMHAVQGDKCPA
jgi:ABC-type polysaccharide/polyol phosphate export permease